jgi:hypothetical protein
MFSTSLLLALALGAPSAQAANTPKIKNIRVRDLADTGSTYRVVVIVKHDDLDEVANVAASVESDAGAEDLTLVETDRWLHGSAAVGVLPAKEATATLTFYDTGSAALISFTGTVGADGSVSLSAPTSGVEPSCAVLGACDVGEGKGSTTAKITLLAAQLYPADSGYDLAFDLSGSDADSVAYADLVLSEGKVETKAEVGFDDIGAVWEGDLSVVPEGLVEVKAKTYDGEGAEIETSKAQVGLPWRDGASGRASLATDEDPWTSVALLSGGTWGGACEDAFTCSDALVVVSQGWTRGDTLPVDAEVELTDGETLMVPANSYQVAASKTQQLGAGKEWDAIGVTHLRIRINGDSLTLDDATDLLLEDLTSPVCAGGTCIAIDRVGWEFDDSGVFELTVSAYGSDAGKLPTSVGVAVELVSKDGKELASDKVALSFDDEVAVVYANQTSFDGDPLGVDLAGQISLLGEADQKGRQKTLAKGRFNGSFARDEDGQVALAGADNDTISAKGDILIGGEPIDFELVDVDDDGGVQAPPVVVMRVYSNGKGTRAVTTVSSGNPGLL